MRPHTRHDGLVRCGLGLLTLLLLTNCGLRAQAEPQTSAELLPTAPPLAQGLDAPTTTVPFAPPAPLPIDGTVQMQVDFRGATSASALATWRVIDAQAGPVQYPAIWTISPDGLTPMSDGDGLPGHYPTALVTGADTGTDYTVQATLRSAGNPVAGVVARQNEDGYYALQLRQDASTAATLALIRYDAARDLVHVLAHTPLPPPTAQVWHTLALTVQGTTLQGALGGAQILTADDATLAHGRAGVVGEASGGLWFARFVVSDMVSGGAHD